MSPVQASTDYSAEQAAAFEGQRASFELINITSKAAEGSDIAFGRAVVQGTADNQAKLPSTLGERLIGITEMTTAWSENKDDLHLYTENREMNIITFGELWVYTEQAVVPGDPVFYRHTVESSPLNIVGRFRKDSSSNNCIQIKGATFESTADAGALARVKLVGTEVELQLTETITDATSTISLLTQITFFDTTVGASTATLPDGEEGQIKTLKMTVSGGNQVVTPDNFFDGATLTFDGVNDSVTLQFIGGNWMVISNNGVVIA